MPIDPELFEGFQREVQQRNPDLHLPQPEDPAFESILDEVTTLDPDLAQRIWSAIPDPDGDAVKGVFGAAAKKGLIPTVAGNVVEQVKGRSTRGQRKVRPVTLLAGGLGLLTLAILVTAVMPEKKQSQTAQAKPVVVEGKPVAEAHPPQVVKPQAGVPVNPTANSTSSPSTAPEPTSTVTPITPASNPAPTPVYTSPSPAPAAPSYTPVANQRAAAPVPIQSSPVRLAVPDASPAPVVAATPKPSGAQMRPQVVALPAPATVVPEGLVAAPRAAASAENNGRGVVSQPASQQAPRQAVVSSGGVAAQQAPKEALVGSGASVTPRTSPTAIVSQPSSAQGSGKPVGFISNTEGSAAPMGGGGDGLVSQAVQGSENASAGLQSADVAATSGAARGVGATEPVAFTSAAAPSATPYQPGVIVPLILDTGVAVYPSSKHPIWAHAADGSIWRGEAALNDQADRILLTFTTVLSGGKASTLNAYAEGADGPGVGGRVHPTARNAAQTAINALLGATSNFVQSQTTQTTTYTAGGLVMQSTQPQPNFWLALGGGLAKAFTVPQTQSAVVPFGQMRAGESVNVRVDIATGPVQAGVQ